MQILAASIITAIIPYIHSMGVTPKKDSLFKSLACSKAINNNVEVNGLFKNKYDKTVDVYWNNYGCSPEPYFSIGKGQSTRVTTYAFHSWVAIDPTNGETLDTYVAKLHKKCGIL